MMNNKNIIGNEKPGTAGVKVGPRQIVAAEVTRRSGHRHASSFSRYSLWTTDEARIVTRNPPIQNSPTHVGGYGATGAGGAVNCDTPNRESTIPKSLICSTGLTQVVDFHDIFRYFSCVLMFGERGRLDRRGWSLANHIPGFSFPVGAGRETHPAATGTVALPKHWISKYSRRSASIRGCAPVHQSSETAHASR